MESRGLVFTMGTAAVGSLGMGMYKMLAYENTGYVEGSVNSYVGSDAENFIINSNLSTAWFTLFAAFLIGAFLAEILYQMHQNRKPVEDTVDPSKKTHVKTETIESVPASNDTTTKATVVEEEKKKSVMDWVFDL